MRTLRSLPRFSALQTLFSASMSMSPTRQMSEEEIGKIFQGVQNEQSDAVKRIYGEVKTLPKLKKERTSEITNYCTRWGLLESNGGIRMTDAFRHIRSLVAEKKTDEAKLDLLNRLLASEIDSPFNFHRFLMPIRDSETGCLEKTQLTITANANPVSVDILEWWGYFLKLTNTYFGSTSKKVDRIYLVKHIVTLEELRTALESLSPEKGHTISSERLKSLIDGIVHGSPYRSWNMIRILLKLGYVTNERGNLVAKELGLDSDDILKAAFGRGFLIISLDNGQPGVVNLDQMTRLQEVEGYEKSTLLLRDTDASPEIFKDYLRRRILSISKSELNYTYILEVMDEVCLALRVSDEFFDKLFKQTVLENPSTFNLAWCGPEYLWNRFGFAAIRRWPYSYVRRGARNFFMIRAR